MFGQVASEHWVPEEQIRRKRSWSGVEREGHRRSHPNISCIGEAAHEHRSRLTDTEVYQFGQCVLEEAKTVAKEVKRPVIPQGRLHRVRWASWEELIVRYVIPCTVNAEGLMEVSATQRLRKLGGMCAAFSVNAK